MSSTKIQVKVEGTKKLIEVSGYIGENSPLFDEPLAGITELQVDLDGVNYLNSVGVKNWILWTRKFPPELKVTFLNCQSLVINQVNLVVDFLPQGATIETFYIPYHCDDCKTDKTALLSRGTDFTFAAPGKSYSVKLPPEVPCVKCKKPMELDVLPMKFFAFLNRKQ